MTQDVSGFGFVVNIVASNTFPAGFTVTQAAEDADAVDFTTIKIAEATMGVNGDLIVYRSAKPLPLTINVIPGSADDQNLQILADANRVAQNKSSAADSITATIIYPDKSIVTLTTGVITDAVFGKSIAGSGRLKTKPYGFMFQNKIGL